MINGVIFDFDGTLFDSMFIWDTIGEDYLRSLGYEPKENLNDVFKTMSLYQAVCYYKSEYGVTLSVDELMTGVNKKIEHYYANIIIPKKGVELFLQKLQEHKIKMCIATATDRYMVESALKRCGLDDYFTDILTCSSVGHGKDEPNIFRDATASLKTKKQNTLIFEDSLYAIKTAKKDGFSVVGVFDKTEKNTSTVKELADLYLSDFSDFDSFWKFASRL